MQTLFENIVKDGSQANQILELTTYNSRELAVIADRELARVEGSPLFKFRKTLEDFQAALAPVGEAFLKLATPLIEFGTKVLERFNQMGDGAKMFVVGLTGAIGVVAPAALMLIGLLANGIANLMLFGSKISQAFSKASGSSNLLTEQINYMNSEQLESAAVAASLDQVHQTLIQTFNVEAGAVNNLTSAYGRAMAAQQQFLASQGAAGARGRGGSGGTSRYNPFMPPGYADGILSVPGPKGAGDIIAAMLSPGEAVIPADMAEKYAPFINSIIADNVPGFVSGKKVQRGHIAPELNASDPAIQQQLIAQGIPEVDVLDPNMQFLPDLTMDMPDWVNQSLKTSGGVDPDIWKEAMGVDAIPGALKETLSSAMDQVGPEVDQLADDIQTRVVDRSAKIAKERGGAVTDEIVAEAADAEIAALEKSDKELERKAGAGLRKKQKTASVTRSKYPEDADAELKRRIAAGEATQTEGGTVYSKGGTKIGRVRRSTGKLKGGLTANIPRSRGGISKPYPSRPKVELSEEQLARQEALRQKNRQKAQQTLKKDAKADAKAREQTIEANSQDIYMTERDRNSPHPQAGKDGAADQRAYDKGRSSVRKGGAPLPPGMAPPPPPPAPTPSQSRFSGMKRLGNRAMDAALETGPGRRVANYFAGTSGANITNSQGKVVSTLHQEQAAAAKEQAKAAKETSRAAKELNQGAQELEQGAQILENSARQEAASEGGGTYLAGGGGNNKGEPAKGRRAGSVGGAMGLSMGLSALTMGASMAPGAIGEQAQKFMPALMGLSMAPMLFQALQSPIMALIAVLAAVGASIFMLNSKMKESQKEAYEMGKAIGASKDAMRDLSEFAGTVSSGEYMDKVREERVTGVNTAPGKTTFGESFVENEAGQNLIKAAEMSIAQTGNAQMAINQLTSQLSTAVISGVISKEQASSIASNVGLALNDMNIALQVRANISELVGPNGEDLSGGDILELSAKMTETSMQEVDSQINAMNNNLEGVFGDELSERVGGSIAAGLGGAAVGAGLGFAGAKIGAALGSAILPGVGTVVGLGLGAIVGSVAGYFIMKDAAEEAGKLSGAVVATMTNALEQQQELSDALDAYYLKKIEEAKVQGDITEQLRLQAEYEEKKVEMSEQEMAMREQMRGALEGPGAEAARTGIGAAIETRFQDDPAAQLLLPAIEATMSRLDMAEADQDVLNLELATGAISPAALNNLLMFIGEDETQRTALLDVVGKFGGTFADETSQVMSLIDDKELAADIFVNISNAGNEQEAEEILGFVREIQRQDAVFDTDIILNYMTNNEEAQKELQEIFDRADMGVVTAEQAYEINPKLNDPAAFDEAYFNMLPDTDKEQYVKTVSMILAMDEAELQASDDFLKWTGDEGLKFGAYPGNRSFSWWQKRYAEDMGAKVTSELSTVDTTTEPISAGEEETDGGGGGPQGSMLDDLLQKLKQVRDATIEVTEGWAASRAKLDELFGDGRNIKIFGGIEQQMRSLGLGQNLIEMIAGMDPEEYERRKNELFQFDSAGNIVGITNALGNMGRALNAIALGDFQNEQQRVLSGLNDQIVAMRKLTAAGMSTANAYEAVKDAAFAAAIAREKDNDVIRETIKLTEEATEATRAYQAAQALAKQNAETGDLRNVIGFINKNTQSLSEAQKEAILSDKNLQTLIMNPEVDPKTLREALKNAENQAELDLKIKKLTFEGLVEVFEDGFGKAMEAFSVKEKEIELDFDVKKDPFLDAIKDAEEDIADIRNRAGGLDDLQADLERISFQEDDINETYDARKKALDQVLAANKAIQQQQKSQLDVAEALSRGDIAAAAQAVQQYRQQQADAASKKQSEQLELAREKELAQLVGQSGKTRKELEEEIKQLNQEIFNIEELRLEPAQRQVELLDRSKAELIEGLEVLGKTREEWERTKNNVDLAKISSDKFINAMQEALSVVEDITSYWEEMDGQVVDLFVNVQQMGVEPEELVESIAGAAAPDGGGGGGGGEDMAELLEQYEGRSVGGPGRDAGSYLEEMREPLPLQAPYTVREAEQVDQLVLEADQKTALHQERLADVEAAWGSIADAPKRLRDEVFSLSDDAYHARNKAEAAQADLEERMAAAQTESAYGDPMAIFNTGAASILDATNNMLQRMSRNAQGEITGNIGGYFQDLGVKVPTLLQAIPGFWTKMSTDTKDQLQGSITDFFRTIGASIQNFESNLGHVGNVFAQMPETVRTNFETKLAPYFENGLPGSLDNIGDWWWDLDGSLREEIFPLIQQQMFDLGENAKTDLEGTLGTYWDAFPGTIQEAFENEVTPFVQSQAEAMGISMDEFLVTAIANMPDDIAADWQEGFQRVWNDFAWQTATAVGNAGLQLENLPASVDQEELKSKIGDALRGGMLAGEEEYQRVIDFLASTADIGEVISALGEGGSLADLVAEGAAASAENIDVVPEAIGQVPEDDRVQQATGEDLPEAFEESGRESGDRFGDEAVREIQRNLNAYQRTNPTVTIKVEYDDPGPPSYPNNGGFIGISGLQKNNGGIIPYMNGGIAKYMAGGTVGGFGNYDKVPALLTPGEFVIRREAVDKYGKSFFAKLNNTIYAKKPSIPTQGLSAPSFSMSPSSYANSKFDAEKSGVMYNNSYQINVNVKSEANPDQIARTVRDSIKRVDSQRIRSNRL